MKKLLLLFFLPTLLNSIYSQTQKGVDVDGQVSKDQFGSSISLSTDGNRIAIGALYNDEYDTNAGQVTVFDYTESNGWQQFGQKINGNDNYSEFGREISLSGNGNRLAIGAPNYNKINVPAFGQVQVYEIVNDKWIQIGQNLSPSSNLEGDFGFSVSLSQDGNRIAVGIPDSNALVKVYEFDGTIWNQLGENIVGEQTYDDFGFSTSLSQNGNIIAVGARYHDGGYENEDRGHVRIFEYNGSSWVQLGQNINGIAIQEKFGSSLSLSADGTRIIIGGDGNGISIPYEVRAFEYVDNQWIQMGQSIVDDGYSKFGNSVSMSADGKKIVIGAKNDDENGSWSGTVKTYEYHNESWIQLGSPIYGEQAFSYSGSSVSISGDGNTIALGAPENDGMTDYQYDDRGHVQIFDLTDITLSIEDYTQEVNRPSFYPNPIVNEVYIKLDKLIGFETLQIYNVSGKLLKSFNHLPETIDFSNYSKGIYFIKILNQKEIINKKIIKN